MERLLYWSSITESHYSEHWIFELMYSIDRGFYIGENVSNRDHPRIYFDARCISDGAKSLLLLH